MGLGTIIKEFWTLFLKSLNPKYYMDLGDKKISSAFQYFLLLLLLSFIFMALISVPKMVLIKSDLDKSMTNLDQFKISGEFKTAAPIMVPFEKPYVILDTSGNRSYENESLFITNSKLIYNIAGKKGETPISGFDFSKYKKESRTFVLGAIIFILPSLAFFFYLAYLAKYLILLLPLSILFYLGAKVFRNRISISQSIALSFYTATAMVVIEILTIPFFIKNFLLTYGIFGINISLFAITVFLILYVTAIRINGNRNILRE